MYNIFQDLRFGFRMLIKQPGFTVVAVLTLALGIGANTAIFSIIYGVLLKPLPYENSSRLVAIHNSFEELSSLARAELIDLRERVNGLEEVAASDYKETYFSGASASQWLRAAYVTPNMFSLLGVQPLHGRAFLAEEETNQNQVAILSHHLWQSQFGSQTDVIGKTVELDGKEFTVIGIMPPRFRLPWDIQQMTPSDLWVPLQVSLRDLPARALKDLDVVARARGNLNVGQIQAELNALVSQLQRDYPNDYPSDKPWMMVVTPLQTEVVKGYEITLLLLFGASGFLLLLVGVNVTNLMLSSSASHMHDFAIRAALGASRFRLVRQVVVEGALIGLLGGIAGMLIAILSLKVFLPLIPEQLPRMDEAGANFAVLGFAAGVSLLIGLMMGMGGAVHLKYASVLKLLQENARATQSRRTQRVFGAMVIAEVAFSLLLLTGASLMLNSLWRLNQVDPGFNSENVLTVDISLPKLLYRNDADIETFYRQAIERIENLPGVENAAAVRRLPLGSRIGRWSLRLSREDEQETAQTEWQVITPDYFEVFKIPIIKGRQFTKDDSREAPGVVIVNEAMARQYWADGEAVGTQIRLDGSRNNPWITVVAVVRNVSHQSLASNVMPRMYIPLAQAVSSGGSFMRAPSLTLAVRTETSPETLTAPVRSAVHSVNPNVPVNGFITMNEVVTLSLARPRFLSVMLGAFAAVAVALAAVGLFGVLSFAVRQRTREIGVRTAVGARPVDIWLLVMRRGMALTSVGISAGLVLAISLSHYMSSLVFGITAKDPWTFAFATTFLFSVAVVTTWVPAWRATRVDPMVALRYE